MLSVFDAFRDLTFLSVSVRMLLAVLCGGVIGIERGFRRRPAGFRTHILICLGAAMTTLTSQYLSFSLGYYTDIARLGAQVVAGVGFIGAGTIIVTRRQRVKGLTTAAGLWASAIIGLSLGAGFFEGAIIATVLVLLAESLFVKWEYKLLANAPEINLYMEYSDKSCLDAVLQLFRRLGVKLLYMEVTRSADGEKSSSCAIFSLRLHKRVKVEALLSDLLQMKGVLLAEEI